MSLHILIHHSGVEEVLDPLRDVWKEPVQKAWARIHSTFGRALKPLTRSLHWVMKTQPDYQPLNEVELIASYRRRRREHDLGLEVLKDLRDPRRGVKETVHILLKEKPDFDVYLMMVAERTLVFHGYKDPEPVLAQLHELHQDGPPWFQQSAVYAAPYPAAGLMRGEAAQWYRDNQGRLSLIGPIFDTVTAQEGASILVLGAGKIFDLEDWIETPVLKRSRFGYFGEASFCNGSCCSQQPAASLRPWRPRPWISACMSVY
jgi:hypothetical protein